MKKTLDQNAIDALFAEARTSPGKQAAAPPKKVSLCDLGRLNHLTVEQVAMLTTLHESFAHQVTTSLGAHLRAGFEMHVVSVEQLAYGEFLERLPELTYYASVHAMPIDARVGLQIDMGLAYAVIEVNLGGDGSEKIESRDLTEIEEHVFESVLRLILRDLRNVWAPLLDLDFQFEQRLRSVQVRSAMIPSEKILCISFEMRVAETSGTFAAIFPAVISSALLRRLSAQTARSERIPSRHSLRRIREKLLDSNFTADLSLPSTSFTVRQLVGIEPGQVLALPARVGEPLHLNIARKPMFLALAVQQRGHRGAKIHARLSASRCT